MKTKEERLECKRRWRREHPESGREAQRRWCMENRDKATAIVKAYHKAHPEARRAEKRRIQARHNAETQELATMSHQRWDSFDDAFLMVNAQKMTARNIAFALERTYCAVTVRAHILGVPMMTDDKLHGRLTTNVP